MRPSLFSTRLTNLFGIRHPILCGGLIHLADGKYVAAAVNAGGMGFITALSSPDQQSFRDQLKICRDLTEGKPFGVCLSVSRRPEANERLPHFIETLAEEGVRHVETSGHSPDIVVRQLKDAGCVIIHKAPSLRYAMSAERAGVDAITLLGIDGGGHPGMDVSSSFAMAPLAARRLKVPFVIGGGVGTGAHLAAALALGADGVLLGTRMLAAREIWAHDSYKKALAGFDERDTALILSSFKNNHRVYANDTARQVAELEAAQVKDIAQYLPLMDGKLARRAYETGDIRNGLLDLSPSVAYVHGEQTVEQIFDELLDQAIAAGQRAAAATMGVPS